MAYNPTDWKDQVVTEPTRYKIRRQDGSEEVVDIEREPGEVIQEGTKITAERLNNIEGGIDDNVSELNGVGEKMAELVNEITLNEIMGV
ncbi:hypothetical protein [Wukongibacter sp. M2B1]|uniref:hypothetical protein n=1 Tax=Wukongibacter sp. M2B1 TaxID=3088895 RepID=UPI003D7BC924